MAIVDLFSVEPKYIVPGFWVHNHQIASPIACVCSYDGERMFGLSEVLDSLTYSKEIIVHFYEHHE